MPPSTPCSDPVEPGGSTALSVRTVYARVCEPEDTPLADTLGPALAKELADAGRADALRGGPAAVAQWAEAERARFTGLFTEARREGCADVLVRRAVLACAPLALVSGAWLQWLSEPGNAEDPVTLRLLAQFAADVGAGRPGASRGDAHLALMRRVEVAVHARPATAPTRERRIADTSFRLPALALAMSRRPDRYRGEIIGLDLCLRAAGLPPPLAAVRDLLPQAVDWAALDPGRAREPGRAPAADEACAIAAAFAETAGPAGAAAVERGFAWARASVRHWSEEVHRELDAARDPAFEMTELMRARAREASAYHDGFVLGGRPLKEWLTEARDDPGPFLAALADSRLVRPGRSGASRLTGSLVAESGRMFRVFPEEDLAVIRRWIDALPTERTEREHRPAVYRPPAVVLPVSAPAPDTDDGAPAGPRQAYPRLLRRTLTPATRRYALRYVEGWLARSRHGMSTADPALPAAPSADGLRPWLLDQHDRHDSEFQEGTDAPLPDRAALIDSTLQLAPLTLIDGAWLAGHTDHRLAADDRGHFLFATYWDELGNGRPELNHPLIYRAVLREMGIDLPPTASPEFAAWPAFQDRSFELPVYWLAIGRFPRRFEPEILGLNLAMELSGVGGSYRRARQALAHHGFSTMFVDIHNTIDNVATGHSAWAADAVDSYMAQLPPSARAAAWDRIRTGYRSLNPPSGFRARKAARRARVEDSAHV
ncbi:iron-containing redox enzyme family protein [Streptomyces sp. NPDC006422]|uniref:iron-containing redox enzyme family protein n=1 Tax=unclassified Streptomyces TaxID=2593676 RepID=UPI0033A96896